MVTLPIGNPVRRNSDVSCVVTVNEDVTVVVPTVVMTMHWTSAGAKVSAAVTSPVSVASGPVGVEGVVPMAVTVPGALLISIDTMGKRSYYESYHELVPWPIVQLRAQGDWVVRGRPQELAWTAGLDLVWRLSRWSSMTGHRFGPRDLIASFTVTEFAGIVYGGFAVGLGAWSLTESVTDHFPNSAPPLLGPYW